MSSMREILFLVIMSRTILVIFVKAPFWISWIKLLVRFTDKSFGCVDRASGVSRSAKGDDSMLFVSNFKDDLPLLATRISSFQLSFSILHNGSFNEFHYNFTLQTCRKKTCQMKEVGFSLILHCTAMIWRVFLKPRTNFKNYLKLPLCTS